MCYIVLWLIATANVQFERTSSTKISKINQIFLLQDSVCGGYGTDGVNTAGYDHIQIPGAQITNNNMNTFVPSNRCGRTSATVQFGVTAAPVGATTGVPICCKSGKNAQSLAELWHHLKKLW